MTDDKKMAQPGPGWFEGKRLVHTMPARDVLFSSLARDEFIITQGTIKLRELLRRSPLENIDHHSEIRLELQISVRPGDWHERQKPIHVYFLDHDDLGGAFIAARDIPQAHQIFADFHGCDSPDALIEEHGMLVSVKEMPAAHRIEFEIELPVTGKYLPAGAHVRHLVTARAGDWMAPEAQWTGIICSAIME